MMMHDNSLAMITALKVGMSVGWSATTSLFSCTIANSFIASSSYELFVIDKILWLLLPFVHYTLMHDSYHRSAKHCP